MAPTVADLMNRDIEFCIPDCSVQSVARTMAERNVGSIPVVDNTDHMVPIGILTDRDIVTRVIARDKNPLAYTAETAMSDPAVTVQADAPLNEVLATMEKHQIRRVPVVNEQGCCAGMISQSDVAWSAKEKDVAELVREVSRETGVPSK